jgi:indole-3-glycerol phosphate synthase
MELRRQFNLRDMESLKKEECTGLRNLIARGIVRERPLHHISRRSDCNGIIAEIKPASPLAGEIKRVDPSAQAHRYMRGGACAVSVLTDMYFFGGEWSNLYSAAMAIDVPVLCKEFIFFREQIDVAWALGADMVLLIARAVSRERLQELFSYVSIRGMLPMVEVHHPDELDEVLALQPSHVLVNSRNLDTLAIDNVTAQKTVSLLPKDVIAVWASGIESAEDVKRIKNETGANFFLVGSALMKSDDPEAFLKELRNVR